MRLLQLCVDVGDCKDMYVHDEELQEKMEEEGRALPSTITWFAYFTVGQAIARMEVTLDLRDFDPDEDQNPVLNIAIDPREPDDSIHLIRNFRHLIRLAESQAASARWV